MRLFKLIKQFIKREDGAFVIFFAIIIPVLFGIGAISLDGANLINHRARLAEATNEAVLAIAAVNNQNVNTKAINDNKLIVGHYLNVYLGSRGQGEIDIEKIKVDYDNRQGQSDYYVTAAYKPQILLAKVYIKNKDGCIFVSNADNHSGNARKFITNNRIHVTLVVDTSSSMTCLDNNIGCNHWNNNVGQTRFNALQAMVSNVVTNYQNSVNVQFALVPFDIGVPFRPQDAVSNLRNVRDRDELDGERVGCSIAYRLRAPFSQLDFAFWANKYVDYIDTPQYSTIYHNRIFYGMDYFRYRYYLDIVARARNWGINELVGNDWCRDNGHSSQIVFGKHRYSCERVAKESIFDQNNMKIISSQYNQIAQLMRIMYTNMDDARFSIANINTVDIEATLDNLFEQNSVIEFYQPTAPNLLTQRNFSLMCQSAQTGNNALISVSDIDLDADELYQKAAGHIGPNQSAARTFLIPTTTSEADKVRLINDFSTMTPGGGTDTMSGFLRALPIAAQSQADNKIIVIITDGRDDIRGAVEVREALHQAGLCQRVINGLTDGNVVANPATSASIHYISLNPTADDGFGSWQTQCADNVNIFTHHVDNGTVLINLITGLIASAEAETGFYINDPSKK